MKNKNTPTPVINKTKKTIIEKHFNVKIHSSIKILNNLENGSKKDRTS